MVIVDQHAAHERLVYERLKVQQAEAGVARLLDPERRPAFEAGTFREGTDEEVRAAFEGYFGYYGTYSLDVKETEETVRGWVTHHVEGCALPNYVGTDRTRSLELKGDRLTLTTPRERDGEPTAWYRVVWERL